MATRENQGLQIALILFVMLTLLLAVTTFIYYRRSEEMFKAAESAKLQASEAQAAFNIENFKVNALKYLLGDGSVTKSDVDAQRASVAADKIEDITAMEQQFHTDMAMYAASLPEGVSLNYKDLPQHLGDRLREANLALVTQAEEQSQLIKSMAATEDREQKRAEAAVSLQSQAGQDLAAERQNFVEYKGQIDAAKEQLATALTSKNDELKASNAKSTADEKTMQEQISNMENKITKLTEEIADDEAKTFERPDGQVVWANQRERLVWLNLGSADNLRPMETFSVYDESKEGVALGESKGSVEVTRIIDQHLAEARILDDQVPNPIRPGDIVHTPAWSPGSKTLVALAGLIDIDGDGKPDDEFIRDLIHRNGGEVVADGTELSPDTRYLLVGVKPNETSAPQLLNQYSQLVTEAQRFGVQRISVIEFLDYMGWRGDVSTINLGGATKTSDFLQPNAASNVRTPTGSESWRERRPPAGMGESPF